MVARGAHHRTSIEETVPLTSESTAQTLSAKTALLIAGIAVASMVSWPSARAAEGVGAPETGTGPAGGTGPAVTIPNFWDPQRRIEQPPVGAVTSLRFITTDDFPPFNFLDLNGQLTGFNIDLARAVCAVLDIPCTIQARAWDQLINRLDDGTADAVIAGLAITSAHRRRLDFTDVYLRVPARFVVAKATSDLVVTPAGLRGRTLAVVARTAHEAYLAAMFPEVTRQQFPDADAARAAVRDGSVDAHFGDGLQLSFWLQSEAAGGCCAFTGAPYLESRFFGQGHAIAIAKGASGTRQAINAALRQVQASGLYAELYLRYFPIGFF